MIRIVAEAGVNHNGDPDLALRLVDAAAEAGADIIKFQTFRASRLATAAAPKAAYQADASNDGSPTQFGMLQRLELSESMHDALLERSHARGIEFLSTPFDDESLDYLVRLGVRRIKVPSGEITNLPYLRRVGRLGMDVLLSTGMATMEDVQAAIDVLTAAGTARARITALHCTTAYPAPFDEVNLLAMNTIRSVCDVEVGYSDHTTGIEVAVAAAALGARVIEKHFTLDRTLEGPDHETSLLPHELRAMISAVRNIERALGDGCKRPTATELGHRVVARKSLVAIRPVRAGDVFTPENVGAKRPGSGISPMHYDEVIGRRAGRDYAPDELIEL